MWRLLAALALCVWIVQRFGESAWAEWIVPNLPDSVRDYIEPASTKAMFPIHCPPNAQLRNGPDGIATCYTLSGAQDVARQLGLTSPLLAESALRSSPDPKVWLVACDGQKRVLLKPLSTLQKGTWNCGSVIADSPERAEAWFRASPNWSARDQVRR